MGKACLVLIALVLAGCTSTYGLMQREVGRSVAHATVIAGPPKGWSDLPDGRRAFVWELPALVATSPQRCVYTLTAVLKRSGEPNALAAWRVVGMVEPPPECGPFNPWLFRGTGS